MDESNRRLVRTEANARAVVGADELEAHLVAVAAQDARADDAALAERIYERVAPITQRRSELGNRALHARSLIAKVHWLREEADLVHRAVAPLSPCRSGCAHCCYQGVVLTSPRGRA